MAQVKEFIVYSATRASFEALVASGEVDNTQIGIIAESGEFWENGNYHPLVMLTDYLKKTDAVALAKDLTGSIEATPEEFTFRTSAGTKSIRDESAVIRRIKGNTSVWGQIANPNTRLLSDGTTLIALTVDATTWHTLISPQISVIKGHKYLFEINPLNSLYAPENYSLVADTFRVNIGTPTFYTPTESGAVKWDFRFSPTSNGFLFQIQCFDLTAIYGAGNEPTTLEEFKELYPESYYPYCELEVRSMRATGIETIGANAFDKDSVVGGLINADGSVTSNDIYSVAKIEVVPYEKYTLTNVANAANTTYTYALYDSEDRFISVGEIKNSVTKPVSVSGDVTMPMNARYMRVVVHNDYLDSCCVNLKHSGTLTAEEATYFKEVRMLPDIAKYFPEGMHGIGGVFDEINEVNVVKRFGVVDLGTLSWHSTTASTGTRRWQTLSLTSLIKGAHQGKFANMRCAKYDTVSADNTWFNVNGISAVNTTTTSGIVNIYDSDKDAATTPVADFVASLQGVLLYYELAEPIVTPVTEPLQWDYKVADFGTEEMLSDLPSSPFRADIVYQFNAADRIRDNGRNIERLEEQLEPFVREIEVLDGLIGVPALKIETGLILHNRTARYALPTSSESNKSRADYVLATEDYIRQNMPTEAAPATQVVAYNVSDGSVAISPNIMYECQFGIGVLGTFVFPPLYSITGDYEKVWMMRLTSIASSNSLSIAHSVKWKDGIAPTFSEPVCLEIYLKKISTDEYIGEWKIYK